MNRLADLRKKTATLCQEFEGSRVEVCKGGRGLYKCYTIIISYPRLGWKRARNRIHMRCDGIRWTNEMIIDHLKRSLSNSRRYRKATAE